jgi:hypothetical protein
VRSILDNKLDRQAAQRPPANGVPIPEERCTAAASAFALLQQL